MPSKLRRNPVLGALLLGFGLLALVVTIAALTKGPATPAKPFSYSDLRDAIQQRKVKSATLKPAQGKVEVVLKDGKEHVGRLLTDRRDARRAARRLGRAGRRRHELRPQAASPGARW